MHYWFLQINWVVISRQNVRLYQRFCQIPYKLKASFLVRRMNFSVNSESIRFGSIQNELQSVQSPTPCLEFRWKNPAIMSITSTPPFILSQKAMTRGFVWASLVTLTLLCIELSTRTFRFPVEFFTT